MNEIQKYRPMGLVPGTFDELMKMSVVFSKSGLMPKGVSTPDAVFVAIQCGMEIGLSPMQAVQNIAVINGKPAIYGDAMLGVVRASGMLESFLEVQSETSATCTAKRKGQTGEISSTFTVDDAKKAKLWGKSGPWTDYPKRMMQMRARGFVLRDGFSDILRGLVAVEEAQDYKIIKTAKDVNVSNIVDIQPEPDPPAVNIDAQLPLNKTGKTDNDSITAEQRKYLFVLMKQNGITGEKARDLYHYALAENKATVAWASWFIDSFDQILLDYQNEPPEPFTIE